MSVWTRFFNLIKPAKTDGVKVGDFNDNMDIIDAEMHKPPLTVNGVLPDENTRDIRLETVPLADNLSSDDAQFNQGTFLVRMSGGGASIADGTASLSTIKGNTVKTGYVPEVLNMTVNAVPRVAPPAITAVLDAAVFEAYVAEAGTYTLTYTTAWSADPADYGVTVSNTPVSGDNIVIEWDGETEPDMTVNTVERPVPAAITATIDKAVFRAYVQASGTVTLAYTTAWSANPALYGITVYNTPVTGDSIVVEYTKENRGVITPASVSVFNSTGWNLFQSAESYARVVRYSDEYGYKIGGSYSLVNFATTPTGSTVAITVDGNGYFNVPADGYVIVTGADATTYIYATWSDWTEGYEGEFESYIDYTVDFSNVMVMFGAGLLSVGDVRDEINFNTQKAISRIERLDYTPSNLEAVIASGLPYDTDTSYIYAVRATYVEADIAVDATYTVSDHGIEFYTATTTVPPITETIYGNNLKDKLRTDVLTISAQTLSANQQAQVLTNIGGASQAGLNSANAAIANLDPRRGNISAISNDTYLIGLLPGTYQVVLNSPSAVSSGYIPKQYGTLVVNDSGESYKSFVFISTANATYTRICHKVDQTWYGAWQELALKSDIPTVSVGASFNITLNDKGVASVPSANIPTVTGKTRSMVSLANFSSADLSASQIPPTAIQTSGGDVYILGSPSKTYSGLQLRGLFI